MTSPKDDICSGPLKLHAQIERWSLAQIFRITGYTFGAFEMLWVGLEKDGCLGEAEAAGVYYKNDEPAGMLDQLEELRTVIEAGIHRDALQTLLPAAGARNALDCALWDLEAKLSGRSVWQLAGLAKPRPLLTTFTCGANVPEAMVASALAFPGARAIKLKLTGEPVDADRVRAVRAAVPEGTWLSVDANQGFTRSFLEWLMPVLVAARVSLIEQPFPSGQEAWLDHFASPIPIAADESAQASSDIEGLVGRFEVVNIKLDKCGGLTEGLAMARAARAAGLGVMVGNMISTSLGIGPAFLLGQLGQSVDLDGPAFLAQDREVSVQYHDGLISCPEALWGSSQRIG